MLAPFAVTLALGLLWLLASRLAPEAERAEPVPPQPPPSRADLREVTAKAARRSRWSVLTGWAMVMPALWVAPVVFLTAHQPLERQLIDRHSALVAAGARWTDCTVALSTYEAAGRPRPSGSALAVHPDGHPEMSLALTNEREKLGGYAAGDTLRVLLDLEHPELGTFPEPYLPLVHPGRPVATVGFLVVAGVVLLIWSCILIPVHGRRALLPVRWLRTTDRSSATEPPDDTAPPSASWRRVRVHGTVLSWSLRTNSDEDSGTTWRSGLRLDPEATDSPAGPEPAPVAFQEYADRFADTDVAERTAVRLAGAAGWLGMQAGDRGDSLAVLVLDDGETHWGSEHRATGTSTVLADAPAAADRRLHLSSPVLVFELGQRAGLGALVLWPMFVIWLNTTNALRRLDPVAVFAIEVVGAVAFTTAMFGVGTLVERRRQRRPATTKG
ncbi:hypothetical protein ABT093_25730 [Kitasatospora sp. NPDC002551]|uniref:hypothetical protein n=1 Tax=Kitasatospora sp. NPDC002551 TaxID=3154539 RepID=UPI003330477A